MLLEEEALSDRNSKIPSSALANALILRHQRLLAYFSTAYGPAFLNRGNCVTHLNNRILWSSNENKPLLAVLAQALSNDSMLRFAQLLDVVAVDRPLALYRFEIIHHFLSPELEVRLLLRNKLRKDESIGSLTSIYHSASWLERECWDLFGIPFTDHPDLRRILTNYGFDGHPLRKDFPLTGYRQVRYDEDQKSVIEEPVSLTQEFRYFDFLSPWAPSDPFKAR